MTKILESQIPLDWENLARELIKLKEKDKNDKTAVELVSTNQKQD